MIKVDGIHEKKSKISLIKNQEEFKMGGRRHQYVGYSLQKKKKEGRDMGRIKKKKKKAGLAQTTFAQAVHYCSEGTVTCEEISGMGPEHEGDKGGKKEKAKKIKKE